MPAATDTDQAGRTHAIWLLGPGPEQDALTALAGGGELVVADGNHRSLAAQTGGFPRFLAVVTTPASVAIQPYNRLVSELPCTPRSCSTGCAPPARRSARSTARSRSRRPAAPCTSGSPARGTR